MSTEFLKNFKDSYLIKPERTSRQHKIYILNILIIQSTGYSHLSNNRGGWNKHGGGAKVEKSIIVEVGINVEGGIF